MSIMRWARIMVECASPLSLGSGAVPSEGDMEILRDANGLPMLPGTSIAGALRSKLTPEIQKTLFGFQMAGEADHDKAGRISRVAVDMGYVHDSKNIPVRGLRLEGFEGDEVLKLLGSRYPVRRSHVKLDHRGVSALESRGLHERTAVPRGTRFSFDLRFWPEPNGVIRDTDQENWRSLITQLSRQDFRLGGATRRGYGAVKVLTIQQLEIDLTKALSADASAVFAEVKRTVPAQVKPWKTISLKPDNYWRVGGGDKTFSPELKKTKDHPIDQTPYLENVIEWRNNNEHSATAEIKQSLIIPASSIKGALKHRTLFHYLRIKKIYSLQTNPYPLEKLFGRLSDDGHGEIGKIIIDDGLAEIGEPSIPNQSHFQVHNSIDRYSGGTRNGMLYSEELVLANIRFTLQQPENVPEELLSAFECALQDLCEGRLALGAGSAKGHGYFSKASEASK